MTQALRLVFAGTPEPAVPSLRRLIASSRHDVVAVLTLAGRTVPERLARKVEKTARKAIERRFGRPAGAQVRTDMTDALPAERREAIVLTQVLGYTYEEAARIAGVRIGTIRSRVARARRDLLAATEDPRDADS